MSVGAKVREILTGHGLVEYIASNTGAKFGTTYPGFIIGADSRRECILAYHSDTPVECSTTDNYLELYRALLRHNGLECRASKLTLALIVRDTTIEPAPEDSAMAPDRATLECIQLDRAEAYRRVLLYDTASTFRRAVQARRMVGEILTPDGARDMRAKIQTILSAPLDQLKLWRQRRLGYGDREW